MTVPEHPTSYPAGASRFPTSHIRNTSSTSMSDIDTTQATSAQDVPAQDPVRASFSPLERMAAWNLATFASRRAIIQAPKQGSDATL